MIKIKPIIFSACGAFVFSFFTALFAKSGLPIALLKAVIFAVVFGGLAVGIQFVYGNFLASSSAAPEAAEETKSVGGKVDLVVSEEDLPDDKDSPVFFVDGKHIISGDDVGEQSHSQGAVSVQSQNEALDAAEKVREAKAAQNIVQKAEEAAVQEREPAKAPKKEPEAAPAFAPINLAANASPSGQSSPAQVSSPSASTGDDELDDLPDIGDIGGVGGGSASPASEDDEVIEDSEFAQDGSVQVHRQTELADGKVADVKDAPVMAEAIRTILKKEE